ncbi:MAG: 3-deoxy-7-phosphoheptulonate synthase [Candidatus Vesicomyosocius endoextente]|uniref:Phospho-2-dehydro-3-deoxyheptonate aldolase n=1 Tax=Candidatus Vesicomyosocius endoextente TaxID=2738853 RepID=A0A853GD01_9GAMM|nr:3-deoxy-7-phosphoheptulonate synthase [Candidatus Vesicomyosocius endoextente]
MLKRILTKISNIRITKAESITPPIGFIKKYPVKKSQSNFIIDSRKTIANIISGKDKRLLVVVGPCSIHDSKAARDYAYRLLEIKKELDRDLFIIMRVYFEKPRTTIGWKGLIYDPDLNNSFDMEKGFDLARSLLLDLSKIGMPSATEYLDLITPQYISDLISWGAIGARTTESQTHRELASGLSCPVGFKNGTNGNIQIAIDAIISASSTHMFWSINKKGVANRYTTMGNSNCHIILRGAADGPNYSKQSIDNATKQLINDGLLGRVMIDFSHANSKKIFKNQMLVGDEIAKQLSLGSNKIFGVMIESNINEGAQAVGELNSLEYGISITDSCLGWQDTEKLLKILSSSVQARNT